MGEAKRRRDKGRTREIAIAERAAREEKDARIIAHALADVRAWFPDALAASPELVLELCEAGGDYLAIQAELDRDRIFWIPSVGMWLTYEEAAFAGCALQALPLPPERTTQGEQPRGRTVECYCR